MRQKWVIIDNQQEAKLHIRKPIPSYVKELVSCYTISHMELHQPTLMELCLMYKQQFPVHNLKGLK